MPPIVSSVKATVKAKKEQKNGIPSICVRDKALQEQETEARQKSNHNVLYLLLINGYSACIVFIMFLVSLESLVSLILSIGLTIYVFHKHKDNESYNGSTMSWVMLSFVVITPISVVVRLAFNRREQALSNIVNLRATLIQLYIAHACWDWSSAGKENVGRKVSRVNWLTHSDKLLDEFMELTTELTCWLTLPTATRARHLVTRRGRTESKQIVTVESSLYSSIVARFGKIADLCEVLKHEGLPPNEATRIRQWERSSLQYIEGLRIVKCYRTPQALRSFARLFSIFMPPFYAPYYAQLAYDIDSLGMAIAFSCVTSLSLTALFESVYQMEDPFVEGSLLDGVRVRRELKTDFTPRLMALRCHYFPQATDFASKLDDCDLTTISKETSSIRLFSE